MWEVRKHSPTLTKGSIMDYKNSMWGDYSPTPAAPQPATDASQDTQAMVAGMPGLPGYTDAANSKVEGDVGGARAQS